MTSPDKTPSPPASHSATREERLAAKLRENLRRRKSQAKAIGSGAAAEGGAPLPKEDSKS